MKKKIDEIINNFLSDNSNEAYEKMQRELDDSSSIKGEGYIDTIESIQSTDLINFKAEKILDEIDLSNKKLKALSSASKK